MLDSVTKKRIDDLRNILVGKIPSPQSQVEQITTGLIYKFMYDMDEEAVEMGGVASFFVGDYEKYSWKNLFDTKLGGADKVQLYSDAIEGMYNNPTAPSLFREIFKNSFLPFKDPSTLNMFLKEINEFHYSHSEKLGDAFEYLLSFMGSQGDAGQFRTPRHIIDFIVDIVNPKKNETILDPACGTAGFLISSYKHILTQNTDSKLGDKLNASERKQVGDNLVGYDISPDMTRISLVNMYLHQFASPLIHEYDTLSSEDRWNEYYDVILANPPFFSPTGGIQPHTRFGVQSTRAEVLFVDYIIEHLKPTGRSGIVVPEGIIFQNGNAYKTIRKKLIEDCLVGVISLPAGVFQPYSGVKTSILILDKELNQKSENIFFANVQNDGFSLSVQRTPIKKNDLPYLLERIKGGELEGDGIENIKKSRILGSNDFSLSIGNYKEQKLFLSDYPLVKLGEVSDFQNGFAFKPSDWSENGKPIIRIQNLTNSSKSINRTEIAVDPKYHVSKGDLLISWSATIGVFIWDGEPALLNQHIFLVKPKEEILRSYLYFLGLKIKERIESLVHGNTMTHITKGKFLEIEIPLPPIEVQHEIVDELEGYQKIIDGCRQVVENYKPTIDIDPSWEMVELGDLCDVVSGYSFDSKDFNTESGTRVIKITNVGLGSFVETNDFLPSEFIQQKPKFIANTNDIAVALTRPIIDGGIKVCKVPESYDNSLVNQRVAVVKSKEDLSDFVFLSLSSPQFSDYVEEKSRSLMQPNLSVNDLKKYVIPVPNDEVIQLIVKEKSEIKSVVEGNRKLMAIYTQKIQDRISKVWGEGIERETSITD